jgi:GH15 family glucan-1,4-alpha-glucosidase
VSRCSSRNVRGPAILDGDEGTFLLCTFWLAQAQALAGELERAHAGSDEWLLVTVACWTAHMGG